MRLVIDLQGAQSGSRFRGIGRYSLSLAKAIVRNRGEHEIIVALSGLFPETIESIRAEFAAILPSENIRVWEAIGPTRETDSANKWRREVSERIREAFLASLEPDLILITSLFEGLGDDSVGSIGVLDDGTPAAVILYDLIPLLNPDEHFRSSPAHQLWYRRKIAALKRSRKLLAISESSRQEALSTGFFEDDAVINISGACDDSFRVLEISAAEKQAFWKGLGISKPFVMYTGGADERKNLHRLIEAYARMPRDVRRRHHLLLAGKMPASYVASYIETGRKCGLLQSELIIPGYVEDLDLIKLYNTCALFVFPSLHEGFGLPPLEAMACGAPVIGANVTSLPEVIGLEEAMFDPRSVEAITAKMTQALVDPEFRARLIAHGSRHFHDFSWDKSALTALEALSEFGKGRPAGVSPALRIEKTAIFRKRRLRILVVKLDHLGDFVLAIPALSKLRARYPYATIDLVIGSWNIAIAEELRIFDNIYTYDFFRKRSSEDPSVDDAAMEQALKQLGAYDIALDLRRPKDTRFFLIKINANMKIGYETLDRTIDCDLDVAIRSYPDTISRVSPLNETPMASQILRVIDAIPEDDNDYVEFPDLPTSARRERGWVAVFPRAGNPVREWDDARLSNLVSRLTANELVGRVNIYFGSDKEALEFKCETHAKLATHVGLSFRELSLSLSRNSICVSNNSGGGHLASYLGLTVVGIYSGHELPAEWGPQFFDSYAIERAAECAPCHGAKKSDCPHGLFCLSDILLSDVYAKVNEVLARQILEVEGPTESRLPTMSLQRRADTIVRPLIDSIAALNGGDDRAVLAEISEIIAKNHPAFSGSASRRSIVSDHDLDHTSDLIQWVGFSGIEPEFRWTDGNRAALLFNCAPGAGSRGQLELLFDTFDEQRLIVKFNGRAIVDRVESGAHLSIKMDLANFKIGANKLELELPDARMPDNGDSRELAIAVRGLRVQMRSKHPDAVAAN